MNMFASAQRPGMAKGFGLGMVAVLLAYAGLYGWVSANGPGARAEREGKLVSRTVSIERVLPINPPIEGHGTAIETRPVYGPPATALPDEVHTTGTAHAPAEPVPAPEEAHAEVPTPDKAPEVIPEPTQDVLLKDVKNIRMVCALRL
jgi:hypothetical protein